MPCPKGYKHSEIHPRPNRQKPVAGKCPPSLPALLAAESKSHEDQLHTEELPSFTCLDAPWLKAIGILL